jgi:hypothetical protein
MAQFGFYATDLIEIVPTFEFWQCRLAPIGSAACRR